MKKLLFIKDGLSIGGTTSSFISLMNLLCKQEEFSVEVWVNNINRNNLLLPSNLSVIESEELEIAFRRPTSKFGKLLDMVRFRQLFLQLKAQKMKKTNYINRELIAIYQEMDINRAKRMKKIDLSSYDVVITWEELFPEYLLAEAVLAKRKIAWIHPDYKQCGFSRELDKQEFQKLDAIVAVSPQSKNTLEKSFPEFVDKIKNVNNYLNVTEVLKKSYESIDEFESDYFTIVTVARLQNISKALDRAVKVTARLKEKGYKFRWYVIGEGEDRENISKLAQEYGVENIFVLLGGRENPYPYIKRADLFVLQSYYEGRPMSVEESLVLGTPVLVTNYEAARGQVPKEYGWIVNNSEDDIYHGIAELLKNPELVKEKRRALSNLNLDSYTNLDKFIKMINEVL